MRRAKRTPLDDAGYSGTPSWSPDPGPALGEASYDTYDEDPDCTCSGGGRDDIGLFLDICLSVCSAPEEERPRRRRPLKACGGRSCVSDDCTADTWSSSAEESTHSILARAHAVAQLPPPKKPPLRSGADSQERRETPPARTGPRQPPKQSPKQPLKQPPKQPPKPSREKVRQVGTRALPPPTPLRINIVYRDRSFGSDSESVISESVTIGTRSVSKGQRGSGTRQSSSAEGVSSVTRNTTPTDAALKGLKGWTLLDRYSHAGKSHILQTPAAKAKSPQGRRKKYKELDTCRPYLTNGKATVRPSGATSVGGSTAAASPGRNSLRVRGRVRGSTLRRLFSGKTREAST